jgi:hypothetical protein
MGVGMASIFATDKPALSVSSHVAAFFVVYFLHIGGLRTGNAAFLCSQFSSTY